ncbi:hypothetical protein HK100_012507 [Physocladia obscura]|uniref:Uncharacterized protein n=1 Tax=Physocladia obscura TaxID=109957 RepID=A0AAD5T5P2_9FUNG|nr:hypothetical protein HK100_012507 [Physocladia obscura]
MVETRNNGKRASSAGTTTTTATTKKIKNSSPTVTSPASTKIPFSVDELASKKKALNKVAPPKPAPNLKRVPHPKKLEEIKKKLKVVTPVVKTAVVVRVGSPKKAASSPSKSPKRLISPVAKRPSSG